MENQAWMEVLGWIGTLVAVVGVVLNNRLRIEGFCVWWVSNVLFAVIHAAAGMVAMTVRDLVFLGLAVHGFIVWRKKQKAPKTKKCPYVTGIVCLADEDCIGCLHDDVAKKN
jgi:nicotinamide riboside transporter PnuC